MLNDYRPTCALVALWPTQDFEFPNDAQAFGKRISEALPHYTAASIVQGETAFLPPEMPRLQIHGDGGQWQLELAPARVGLTLQPRTPAAMSELFTALRAEVGRLTTWLAENCNFRVYRIGCLVQFVCPTRSSANDKIANYFLQPRALQGTQPHEINVNVLTRIPLADWTVNRWFRVRPLRNPRGMDFAAQVEIDLNTLPDDTRAKTGRDIEQFLEAVESHLASGVPVLDDADFLA